MLARLNSNETLQQGGTISGNRRIRAETVGGFEEVLWYRKGWSLRDMGLSEWGSSKVKGEGKRPYLAKNRG